MVNRRSISTLFLLSLSTGVGGSETSAAVDTDTSTSNLRGKQKPEPLEEVTAATDNVNDERQEEEEFIIELSDPISLAIRNRALKKDEKDGGGGGGGGGNTDLQTKYEQIVAQAQGKNSGQQSTYVQPVQSSYVQPVQSSYVQPVQVPAQQQPVQQDKQKQQPQQQQQQQGQSGGTVISNSDGTIKVSGGTLDLRGTTPVNPSSESPKRSCAEIEPIMGCDRGGGDDQKMTFLNVYFGTCSDCDRGLFQAMPTKMAYYCPKYGRPKCGGKCYTASPDGLIRDKVGGVWSVTDPRFKEADRESWGGLWPANFGCPSCN